MAFADEFGRYGDRCQMYPQDEFGLLPLEELLGPGADGAAVYCCGPEPLIDAVERLHRARRSGSLHVERFRPRQPGAPAGGDSGFDVIVNSSGAVVRVAPGQSILTALTGAGIDVPSSCQEGTCASCETVVLDGAIDHRDSVLTQGEREGGRTMMLCVSRALSDRLVLDLLSAVTRPCSIPARSPSWRRPWTASSRGPRRRSQETRAPPGWSCRSAR
jgi:ferredoxin